MRRTLRLLAAVKPARYLEAGNPTGLTGVYTHSSPRSTLLFLYSRTLEKLQQFPEASVYRQSVEALTKHRMSIVEAAVPPGYQEWAAKAQKIMEENPDEFNIATSAKVNGAAAMRISAGGKTFVHRTDPQEPDTRDEEWDGEKDEGVGSEGLRGPEERESPFQAAKFDRKPLDLPNKVQWEAEPQLTADQIEEIENKIGAGLIEEVISVAEGEIKLVDIMHSAKVWESLEEQPAPGQWEYFERKTE